MTTATGSKEFKKLSDMVEAGEKEKAEVTLHDMLHEHFFGKDSERITDREDFDHALGELIDPDAVRKLLTSAHGEQFHKAATECFELYNQAHTHALERDLAKGADPKSENKVAQVFEELWNKIKSVFHAVAAAVQDKSAQRKLNHMADLIEGKTWGQRSAKMCAAAKVKAHEFGKTVHDKAAAAGKAMASAGASMKDAVSKHMPKKKTEKGQGQGV